MDKPGKAERKNKGQRQGPSRREPQKALAEAKENPQGPPGRRKLRLREVGQGPQVTCQAGHRCWEGQEGLRTVLAIEGGHAEC